MSPQIRDQHDETDERMTVLRPLLEKLGRMRRENLDRDLPVRAPA